MSGQPSLDVADESKEPESPARAAAAAALARFSSVPSADVAAAQTEKAARELKMRFLKIIDDEIVAATPQRPQALTALELLQTLLANALTDPTKRSVRLSNRSLLTRLAENQTLIDAVTKYLHEAVFKHEVISFEARRTFPPEPTPAQLERLKVGEETLRLRTEALKKAWQAPGTALRADKESEQARKRAALKHIEDDRQSVRVRIERERTARERAAPEE